MAAIPDHGSLNAECEDTYTHFRWISTGWVERTRTLDILPFANVYSGDDDPDDDFPSWVINWELKSPQIWATALPCRFRIIQFDESRRPPPKFIRRWVEEILGRYLGATPETQPSWVFHDRGKSLSVSAVLLTRITSHFTPSQGSQGLVSVLCDGFSGISHAEGRKSRVSLSIFLGKAKRGLKFGDGDRIFMWLFELRKKALDRRGKECIEDLMVTDERLQAKTDLINGILRDERLRVVCCEASAMCPGGPAIAARGAQEGDTVALVSGVSYPLVLRPYDQKRFRLVGPLFLPGVMKGELKDALKPELFHEIVLV